jgi:hypothetical protein
VIALVSCGKAKLDYAAPAKEMYTGNLFRAALDYCTARHDRVLILSAKYGLLAPEQVITPYDVTLADLPYDARVRWGKKVVRQLIYPYRIHWDGFVLSTWPGVEVHAGEEYLRHLISPMAEYRIEVHVPCRGMQIGERLSFYKKARTSHKDSPAPGFRILSTEK